MSLLSGNDNTSNEENVNTETTNEVVEQQETVETGEVENVETVDTETSENEEKLSFLDEFKNYMGEEYDPKFENTYKKFEKDGDLDKNALFKAYRNLEKSFSEKREAPENYEIEYGEDIEEQFRLNDDSELYQTFEKTAKELNITNDQYKGLMTMMSKYVQEDTKNQLEAQEKAIKEMKQSIPNFDERASAANDFLQSKLEEKKYNALAKAIIDQDGLEAIEDLMKMNRDPVVPRGNEVPDSNDPDAELEALLKQRDSLPSEKRAAFHNNKIKPFINKYF